MGAGTVGVTCLWRQWETPVVGRGMSAELAEAQDSHQW